MNAEEYIDSLPMWAREKNSIPAIRGFLDELGSPDSAMKVIHVAGTNGKGSICAYLTRAAMDAGVRTGTFISPHLVDIKERILIDGEPVSNEIFEKSAGTVRQKAEELKQKGYVHPTYFEFLFYTALLSFQAMGCGLIILETGLGGRLDATNVCSPCLTVLASISFDHMQYLGNTIREIAGEKAGIIKPGVPVVYDRNNEEAEEVILRRAAEMDAPAYPVSGEAKNARFAFLSAPYMRENAAVAEQAWELLKKMEGILPEDASQVEFPESVRRAYWAGRMDEIAPCVFLDGAHNEDGVRAFLKAAEAVLRDRGKKPVLLLSAVNDKDLRHIAERFASLKPERIYLAPLNSYRAADISAIAALLEEDGAVSAEILESVPEAFRKAVGEKKEDEILFCTGSLYLVGEILESIRGSRQGDLK